MPAAVFVCISLISTSCCVLYLQTCGSRMHHFEPKHSTGGCFRHRHLCFENRSPNKLRISCQHRYRASPASTLARQAGAIVSAAMAAIAVGRPFRAAVGDAFGKQCVATRSAFCCTLTASGVVFGLASSFQFPQSRSIVPCPPLVLPWNTTVQCADHKTPSWSTFSDTLTREHAQSILREGSFEQICSIGECIVITTTLCEKSDLMLCLALYASCY